MVHPHPYTAKANPADLVDGAGNPSNEARERESYAASPNRYSIYKHLDAAHYTVSINRKIEPEVTAAMKDNALEIELQSISISGGRISYDIALTGREPMIAAAQSALEDTGIKMSGTPQSGHLVIQDSSIGVVLSELGACNGPDKRPLITKGIEDELTGLYNADLAALRQQRPQADKMPSRTGVVPGGKTS